ncbi:hypothetical protein K469DRAFT_710598 [Zopfia rhizophila CBS 207.26]|uniref:Uncharacterized protein n=1 Tax=Zopfia rhizophila CBS 207.26 TaxID=1314779 RepID=A0A6A6DUV1_9PEZI|nr:hypothetical protein K469DRAFT_710598 [Zopfia rhizophila CBS 207.26]
MSVINLLGNPMVPTYPTPCLIESAALVKARDEDGVKIDGIVGRLEETDEEKLIQRLEREDGLYIIPRYMYSHPMSPWPSLFCAIMSAIAIAINLEISGSKNGSSMHLERAWMLLWLGSCGEVRASYPTYSSLSRSSAGIGLQSRSVYAPTKFYVAGVWAGFCNWRLCSGRQNDQGIRFARTLRMKASVRISQSTRL